MLTLCVVTVRATIENDFVPALRNVSSFTSQAPRKLVVGIRRVILKCEPGEAGQASKVDGSKIRLPLVSFAPPAFTRRALARSLAKVIPHTNDV